MMNATPWNEMVLLAAMYAVWCGMPFAQDVRGLWLGISRAARLQDKAPDATMRRRLSCFAWHVRWYCPMLGSMMAAVKGEQNAGPMYAGSLAVGIAMATPAALAGWEVWQVGGVCSAMYALSLLGCQSWLAMHATGRATDTGKAYWLAGEMQVQGDRAWGYEPYARYFKR